MNVLRMLDCLKENFVYKLSYKNHFNGVLLGLTTVVAIAVISSVLIRDTKRRGKIIPGRLGIPLLGESLSFIAAANSAKGCYEFVTVRRLRYGSVFKTSIFGRTHVFMPSLEAAKKVYRNEFGLFNKHFLKSMEEMMGRKSLFVVPKGTHEKIRAIFSETFSMNYVTNYVHKIDQMVIERLKEREIDGKSFPVLDFTMKLGFDAICNTLLSITDDVLLEEMEKDCTTICNAMITFPFMIPGTAYFKGIKARERLMECFKTIIADRRSGKTYSEDFLQAMLRRDLCPRDERLDDSEIFDNLITTMISGQSTTATAMMWSVKFLSDNQYILDILREEQLHILKNKHAGALLTYEDVNSMAYTLKVMKETLRMSNIVLWYPRVASEDCEIEGFEIKKGWYVNVDVTHIHYDPTLHKDPLRFDPTRFDEMPKPYTYMPFGSGPRTCLGINMAKVTMLAFLHRLTSGYKWRVDDHDASLNCKRSIPQLRTGYPITLEPLKLSSM